MGIYRVIVRSTLPALALLCACGPSGPKGPAPGTPAFEWSRAETAYKAGDYVRANDLLAELTKSDDENGQNARPWSMVMSLGLANAYMELATKFEEGGLRNRANPAPFRRLMTEYEAKAKAAALQYAEVAHRFIRANQDGDVALLFCPPEATFDEPPEYQKITIGQLIPDAERAGVEKEVIKREVLRSACRALNCPKNPEKAKSAYQDGKAQVPGPQFILAAAGGLYDVAEMFGPKKLDQPQRVKLVLDEAQEALALLKDSKDAKDLTKKITDMKKKMRL